VKALPIECPSCREKLAVKRLVCTGCGTEVEGLYGLPVLASIGRSEQAFILAFVKASGSLKEMARLLGVSYPTVRSRLDDTIEKLKEIEGQKEASDE